LSVRDFYDGLAADYHLVYGGDWDTAVEQQGTALDRLIRYSTLTRAAEDAGLRRRDLARARRLGNAPAGARGTRRGV